MGLTSLRGRMVALAAMITAVLVIGVVVLTQLFAAHASERDARAVARARADGVASGVRVSGTRLRVAEGDNDFLDATAWVFDAHGHLIDGSVPPSVLPTARRLAVAEHSRYVTRGDHLLYARPFRVAGTRGSVVATVDLTPYEASERRLLEAVVLLGVLTVAVAAGVAGIVARRSLAAVHRMTEQADQWRDHDLGRRFNLGPARDEITELGRTLDRMLDRIADALAMERRVTDEIAHELRTPLAGLRAQAQMALSGADDDQTGALGEVIQAADRMESAIGTMLDSARARLESRSGCDAAAVIAEQLGDGEVLRTPGADAMATTTSADVVVAIVAPLLENARRHAATTTAVDVDTTDDAVIVVVRDDGPGFASADVETAFKPGWSTSGGFGLGLAVTRRLANAHGVVVRAHPGPGGRVEVRLPRA